MWLITIICLFNWNKVGKRGFLNLLLAVQMFLRWFRTKHLTMVSGIGGQNSACNCTICYAVGRLGEGTALEKKIWLSTWVAEE